MLRRALPLLALPALAQEWSPSRAITVLVPNPPGGGTDFAARLYADGLARLLGQPVVIENRPGANGNLAIQAAARAVPDGHTILLQYSGYHAGNPAMMRNPGWDPNRDIIPLGMATMAPHVILVGPNLPATLAEFIALVRERPGAMNYASAGQGSIQHIAGVLFSRAIGAEMVHVPYRGAAPALQDVVGGRVEMFITTPSSAVELVRAGRLRALAMASAARSPALPDVPTTAQASLPGFTVDAWFAFFGPAGLPAAVQARFNAALRALADEPTLRARATEAGATLSPMTIAELDGLARREVETLGAVIRTAGISIE